MYCGDRLRRHRHFNVQITGLIFDRNRLALELRQVLELIDRRGAQIFGLAQLLPVTFGIGVLTGRSAEWTPSLLEFADLSAKETCSVLIG